MTNKTLWRLAACFTIAWVTVVSAQTTTPHNGDLPVVCSCKAGRVECLFGTVEGCEVEGCRYLCSCRSGGCSFGFPTPALCECNGVRT